MVNRIFIGYRNGRRVYVDADQARPNPNIPLHQQAVIPSGPVPLTQPSQPNEFNRSYPQDPLTPSQLNAWRRFEFSRDTSNVLPYASSRRSNNQIHYRPSRSDINQQALIDNHFDQLELDEDPTESLINERVQKRKRRSYDPNTAYVTPIPNLRTHSTDPEQLNVPLTHRNANNNASNFGIMNERFTYDDGPPPNRSTSQWQQYSDSEGETKKGFVVDLQPPPLPRLTIVRNKAAAIPVRNIDDLYPEDWSEERVNEARAVKQRRQQERTLKNIELERQGLPATAYNENKRFLDTTLEAFVRPIERPKPPRQQGKFRPNPAAATIGKRKPNQKLFTNPTKLRQVHVMNYTTKGYNDRRKYAQRTGRSTEPLRLKTPTPPTVAEQRRAAREDSRKKSSNILSPAASIEDNADKQNKKHSSDSE